MPGARGGVVHSSEESLVMRDERRDGVVRSGRDANLPWRSWSNLFTGDEAVPQPAVNTGGVHPQDLRGLADRDQFSVGRLGCRLESRDIR
jgi:hypothetical protein